MNIALALTIYVVEGPVQQQDQRECLIIFNAYIPNVQYEAHATSGINQHDQPGVLEVYTHPIEDQWHALIGRMIETDQERGL